jgi:hypothetical protein
MAPAAVPLHDHGNPALQVRHHHDHVILSIDAMEKSS